MTKSIKTSELTGAALDWSVEIASGGRPQWNTEWEVFYAANGDEMSYSTDWAQGGPIIEREKITLNYDNCGPTLLWEAKHFAFDGTELQCEYGQTPLIAAMRCYVASKLGDTIEVSRELIKHV